jgi:hypothetical protein
MTTIDAREEVAVKTGAGAKPHPSCCTTTQQESCCEPSA